MSVRNQLPRVRFTYPVPPTWSLGIGLKETFTSDSIEDADDLGLEIAELIKAQFEGRSAPVSGTVLRVTLFCGQTYERRRTLLANSARNAVVRLVGRLFATIVCDTKD